MQRVTRVAAIAALTLTAAGAAVVSAVPAGADPTPPNPDPAHMIVDKTIGNVDGIGPLSGLMNILGDLMAKPAPH